MRLSDVEYLHLHVYEIQNNKQIALPFPVVTFSVHVEHTLTKTRAHTRAHKDDGEDRSIIAWKIFSIKIA